MRAVLVPFLALVASTAAPFVRRVFACALACALACACSLEVKGGASGTTSLDPGVTSPDADVVMSDADVVMSVDADVVLSVDAAEPPDTSETGVPREPPPEEDAQVLADAGVSEPETGVVVHETDASVQPSGCMLDGRFALRVVFEVNWVGTEFVSIIPIIDAGRGELSIIELVELQTTPSGIAARFAECSSSVPEFVATISRERYQARFDNAVWDSPSMPSFASTMRTSCHKPGCAITASPVYLLIGAALTAADAPWPSSSSAGRWPDHDGNGEPGVAVQMLGPDAGPYDYPPLDLFSIRRVHDLALGLRVIQGLDATLDTCDEFHGTTPKSSIGTRAVGCQAVTRPFPCSTDELKFLNDNLPVWTVRQGKFQARRVAPDADCAEARRVFAQRAP
jgi:hypothetical protein